MMETETDLQPQVLDEEGLKAVELVSSEPVLARISLEKPDLTEPQPAPIEAEPVTVGPPPVSVTAPRIVVPPPAKTRTGDHTEQVPALILLAIALVLGGTAILMAASWQPISLGMFRPPIAIPTQQLPSQSAEDMEVVPTGDGTVLTLEELPTGAALSLQEIYQRVIPSIVAIRAAMADGIAEGTGVVMTANGYIITNAHVIQGSYRVDISLEDGRVFEARLVGRDNATDLAVLKVDATDLIPAQFGDSEFMLVGDTVAAIGNPMGAQLRGTMTSGILSAINRDMTLNGHSMPLLQTTAALNSGNSGGALINTRGQVIGITNMKLVGYTDPIEGLGFAIPTSTVKPVVDSLIENGYVVGRPMLNVIVQAMTPEERHARGLKYGLWVVSVEQKSDAYQQGLRERDILLQANGVDLDRNQDLAGVKDALSVGDTIYLVVDREGKLMQFTVTLSEENDLNS